MERLGGNIILKQIEGSLFNTGLYKLKGSQLEGTLGTI